MRKPVTGIALFSILFTTVLEAQVPGCTDPQAVNYNVSATDNDGSCIYSTTNHSAPVIAPVTGVDETSGLTYAFGYLWTHNDSGGQPELYALDTTTGAVVLTLVIRNATNADWEDVTAGNGKLYIGDFGNNAGTRTDLKIYIVDSAQWNGPVDSADVQAIGFSYADQTDFSGNNSAHNFDAEAMIFFDDTITVFSKNHGDQRTKRYRIPAVPGNYAVSPVDSFDVNGLITGASQYGDSIIVLCGYQPPLYAPFAWIFRDYQPGTVFSGHKRRLELGTVFTMGQMEGISLTSCCRGFISSEAVGQFSIPARLYRLDISSYLSSPGLGMQNHSAAGMEVRYTNGLYSLISDQGMEEVSYSLYNLSGSVVCQGKDTTPCVIRCVPEMAGLYILKVERKVQPGKFISLEFVHPAGR